jgi:hypothetical protein
MSAIDRTARSARQNTNASHSWHFGSASHGPNAGRSNGGTTEADTSRSSAMSTTAQPCRWTCSVVTVRCRSGDVVSSGQVRQPHRHQRPQPIPATHTVTLSSANTFVQASLPTDGWREPGRDASAESRCVEREPIALRVSHTRPSWTCPRPGRVRVGPAGRRAGASGNPGGYPCAVDRPAGGVGAALVPRRHPHVAAGPRQRHRMNGSYRQIVAAVETSSSSLRHWTSSEMRFPSGRPSLPVANTDEKPHCGEIASCSKGRWRAARFTVAAIASAVSSSE